jgi:hypothetical protein
MPRTRPEVTPKISVLKKKLGTKAVGFVGVSLARGKYGFDLGRSRGQGVCWDFFTEGGETGIGADGRK